MLFDNCELSKSKLRSSQVHISRTITLSRKETIDLHTLAKDDIVSGSVILPETSTSSSTACGLLINNECRLRFSGDASKFSHELCAGYISTLIISRFNNDSSNWAGFIILFLNSRSNVLKNLTFLSRALGVLDRRPSHLKRHAWVCKLS